MTIRILLTILLLAGRFTLMAQTTSAFQLEGLVDHPQTITLPMLDSFPQVTAGDIRLVNYRGELKKTYTAVTGVRLKDLLSRAVIRETDPKKLSEYYIVARAADGYAVVISWNELFNTEAGDGFLVLTHASGKAAAEMSEGILLMAVKDIHTGRRHVKGLSSLEVKKI